MVCVCVHVRAFFCVHVRAFFLIASLPRPQSPDTLILSTEKVQIRFADLLLLLLSAFLFIPVQYFSNMSLFVLHTLTVRVPLSPTGEDVQIWQKKNLIPRGHTCPTPGNVPGTPHYLNRSALV